MKLLLQHFLYSILAKKMKLLAKKMNYVTSFIYKVEF